MPSPTEPPALQTLGTAFWLGPYAYALSNECGWFDDAIGERALHLQACTCVCLHLCVPAPVCLHCVPALCACTCMR